MTSRRMLVSLAMAGALATAVPAGASAQGPPPEPGCFGAFVSSFAQEPPAPFANLGEEVSGFAKAPGPFGRTILPEFKRLACGGT